MKTLNKSLVVMSVCAALAVGGCAKQSFVVSGGPGQTATDAMHVFIIGGIGQSQTVNAGQVCGGAENVVAVEAQETFLNGLLGVVTFGIFTPRQYRIMCKS